VKGDDVRGVEGCRRLEREPVLGEGGCRPAEGRRVEVAVESGHSPRIATDDRQRELETTARCHETGDRGRDRGVEPERAAQQRAPREADRHAVGETIQLGRQPFHTGHQQPRPSRVRARAWMSPGETPRRVGHRACIGVDAEHEGVRIREDLGQDGAAVTRPEVDDDPAVAPGLLNDLADVHLGDTSPRDRMHVPSMREPESLPWPRPEAHRRSIGSDSSILTARRPTQEDARP
jgi:hypothetical protein